MRKLLASTLVVLVTAATSFIACGGGSDGNGGGGGDDTTGSDASVSLDASGSSNVDAATTIDGNNGTTSALGQTCTPDSSGSGQGDCPPGYTCLAVEGATHPWCSKLCAMGAGDMCAMGYSGPGVAGCINNVTFGSAAPMSFCGITCSGDGVNGCTTATCDGSCPNGLMCTATLLDGSNNAVGSACQ